MIRRLVTIALLSFATVGVADQFAQTTPETYVSNSGRYRLTVFPLELPHVFMDLTHRDLMVARPAEPVPKQQTPEATLERWVGNRYELAWRKPLVNEVGPGHAIVSVTGSFVTFDDAGYGHENAVVIYSAEGAVVKRFSLSDLMTEKQIENLPRSIGSIKWGGMHIFVDDYDATLLLRLGTNDEWDADKRTYRDVRVRMIDGALLD